MKSILFFATIIVFISCSSTKSATTNTPIYHPISKDTENNSPTKSQTAIPSETLAVDTIPAIDIEKAEEKIEEKIIDNTVEEKIEKNTYNIAVVLPFLADKVPLNYTPYQLDTNIYLSPTTQNALDFYMGAKMATEDYKSKKKINLFFLDDMGSEYQVKKVIAERPFPEVDVIVSNYSNQILKYSKAKEIPLFCPFESDINTEPYEQLIFTSSSQREQSNYLLKKALNNYPEAAVYIVQDLNDDTSRYLVNNAQRFLKEEYNITPTIYNNSSFSSANYGDSTSTFQSISSSIVYIASNKESFVRNTLPKFQSNSSPTYIIGTQSWASWKGLDAGNSTSSVYIPTQELAKVSTTYKENFSSRFLNEFQKSDNSIAYLGYDLITYLIAGLDNNILSEQPTSSFLNLKPIQYNFEFTPSIMNDEIQNVQNNKIAILKLERGRFVLVNW